MSTVKAEELKERIKILVQKIIRERQPSQEEIETFEILGKFPSLKKTIVDLLTIQFDDFIEDIDWVSPKPTSFRVRLQNGFYFYLTFSPRSWIANVEGKNYYLLNLNELENCTEAIARILRYQMPGADKDSDFTADVDSGSGGGGSTGSTGGEVSADTGGEEEVDIDVDTEEEIDIEA
tara:strand:- start:1433 stop:1966 length:534 start_codon:yes stop_codon:yes gene_type:complete